MELKYNKTLLLEDVTFPIKQDDYHGGYIWDEKEEMIAQFIDKKINEDAIILNTSLKQNFITRINTLYKQKEIETITNIFYIKGDTIYAKFLPYTTELIIPIIQIRGWGRLQYKDKSKERQANILNYICLALNS